MSRSVLAPLALCFLACLTGLSISALPEEGVLDPAVVRPAPYGATAEVLSSSPTSVLLEVSVTVTDRDQLPSQDAVSIGLVAISPQGNVQASLIQAEVSPVQDPKTTITVEPAKLPRASVILGAPAIWRDLRVVDVSVAPCWETSDGAAIAHRLLIEITNLGGVGINEKASPMRPVSPIWDRMYRRHVLNYDSLNLSRLQRGTGKRYIVISRTAFDAQTPQFVEWKTRQGYGVDLVTLESLGHAHHPTSSDAMDAMKDYILDAYNNWPETPEFVLLVGDMDSGNLSGSLWTKTFYNAFYSQGYRPHDQWYAFLEGDDLFADIMVGRFPDWNATRMDYQLAKTIAYEKTPHIESENAWQKRGIMTLDSSISATINTKNAVSDHLNSWGMNISEFFSSPWNVTATMSTGFTFYNYRGDYCSSTGWGSTFYDNDVPYVNNQNKPGVFTILSCSSACFDYGYSSTAELLLRHDYSNPSIFKGAVAFVGSQAYTAYQWNNPLDKGFYYAWADSNKAILGEALLSAKIYAWNNSPHGTTGEWNRRNCMMKEYTILGDPSLQVWTDVPEEMTVAATPSTVPMNQTTNVTVSVTTPTRGPVAGALVCFRRDPDVFVYGYADASGEVVLAVTPATEGAIDLTATAYNNIPVLDSITATPGEGPYVVYMGNTILGDGQADIDDDVSLDIELKNMGTGTAYAVQASLSTTEAQVVVTGQVRDYGAIAPGSTALPASPFEFHVGTLPDQTVVPFDLDIVSGDSLWEASFGITIHAPVLAVAGSQVNDHAGNGNGRPDPGETIELKVLVDNSGSGTALNTQITLSDTDPYVTISGPTTQSMGQIPPSSQELSPSFTVSFDAACPPAYSAQIPVQLVSHDGAYAAYDTLILMVGQYDLLFVDADNEPTETRISSALDDLGITYTRWNTYVLGMEVVPTDTLVKYKTVLWAAGDQNISSIIAANQTTLASYLDQGGSLVLSAENYLTEYGEASFTSDYLHVASYQTSISGTGVNGVPGDEVSDGLSVALSYHTELGDWPDRIDPDGDATVVFHMQGVEAKPVAIRYPDSEAGAYRVIFYAVSLEAFSASGGDPNNIKTVINRSLAWVGGGDMLPPTAPTNPAFTPDGTLSWNPASDNVGVDHYLIYRDTVAYFTIQGMTPHTTTPGTSITLPEGIGDPEVNYCFRVTAKDAAGNESEPTSTVGGHDFGT